MHKSEAVILWGFGEDAELLATHIDERATNPAL